MRRVLRLLWLSTRTLFGAFALLGLIETLQGAPSAVRWLEDAGVTQPHVLGPILVVVASIILGLVALGPERVRRWLALARGQEPPPSFIASKETPADADAQLADDLGGLVFAAHATKPMRLPLAGDIFTEAGNLAFRTSMRREDEKLDEWWRGIMADYHARLRPRLVEFLRQPGREQLLADYMKLVNEPGSLDDLETVGEALAPSSVLKPEPLGDFRARRAYARQTERDMARERSAKWINDRRAEGNELLEGWHPMKNEPSRCMDTVRWEKQTHDGLASFAPNLQAHFRHEAGMGSEWLPQRRGPHTYEDPQRAILRRRLHRLSEIAERL